jgi:putative endonuclease
MKPLGTHNYFVYIVTNVAKTVLYIGITNDLRVRLHQHKMDAISKKEHFTGKYNAYYLIYWERFEFVEDAIRREKQLKGWSRKKKEVLINEFNPEWKFLNDEV